MTETRDKVTKTDAEWRTELSNLAYKVTRKKGTERAFSHDDLPQQPGTFACICCGAALFDAGDMFESGTGWLSFTRPIATEAVAEHADTSWFMRRTEVVCATCDAHLGHVFPDGPRPTGPACVTA